MCIRDRLQGITYHFVCAHQAVYTGFAIHALDGQQVQIAEPEKALVDLMQFRRHGHTVDLVLEVLRDNHHQLNLERLTELVLLAPITVQRIFGFLLEGLSLDHRALSTAVHKSTSVSKLTSKSDQYNGEWRLYYDPFFTREMSYA